MTALKLPDEPEVLIARRSVADVLAALDDEAIESRDRHTAGWFGTSVLVDRGLFALVDPAGPLADTVGDWVRLTYRGRSVPVYVVGSQDQPFPIAVTRRAFLELARLTALSVTATVEVIQ